MSFDLNMVGRTFKPKVENTFFNKGGGGGNTGYFQQERQKKKDDEDSILSKMWQEDVLDKNFPGEIPELENEQGLLGKIKGFWGKIR